MNDFGFNVMRFSFGVLFLLIAIAGAAIAYYVYQQGQPLIFAAVAGFASLFAMWFFVDVVTYDG